ncbi:CBM1 domain-containing protein [Pleurotus pulmonarius]
MVTYKAAFSVPKTEELGMLSLALIVALLHASVLTVAAQSPAWGQCGGIGWTGPTTCAEGFDCIFSNAYHSQCLPAAPQPAPGTPIRAAEDPVFHFYLQNIGGVPMLGPESSSARFTVGGTITLNNADGANLYLNAQNSTLSYKVLTLSTAAATTNWGLEGDTIIMTDPRHLIFLACVSGNPSFYSVYLQTGADTPIGSACSSVTLHLP